MTLILDPSRSSKVKLDGANRKLWVLPISATLSNLVSITVFEILKSHRILTLTFDPSGSSKVKFDGANRKPMGTFLYDLC